MYRNKYTLQYATSLEEMFYLKGVSPDLEIDLSPSLTAFKELFNLSIPYPDELWSRIWFLFKSEICIISDDKPDSSNILELSKNFWEKFHSIYITTNQYYKKLINVLKDNENKLMAQISATVEGENRYNDTPYNKGIYNDSNYTTNITRTKSTTTSDAGTVLERIDEIRRKYTDYYTRWANEFESLFVSPLNYNYIDLDELYE